MVKCPRCGYENSPSSLYCDNCAYLLADEDGKRINNTKRKSSWNMGIAKKIVIVFGIILITFLLFSFIYNHSQPTPEESLNVVGDNGTHHQSSSYPYEVVVKYEGDWYAKMGDPKYLVTDAGYGSKSYTLDCAAWDHVDVDVQKQDYGDGNLTVQLIKNGEVIEEQSTANETGHIVIHHNY